MQQPSPSVITYAAVLALGAVSATCAEAGVVVTTPPPPPRVEVMPVVPAVGYIWRPGYWRWEGGGYVWVPGAYVARPLPRAVWVPGHWAAVRGGWVWQGGFWSVLPQ